MKINSFARPFLSGRGLGFILLLIGKILIAQDTLTIFSEQNFRLSTENFSPYFPTYIGNGHFSLSSTQLGISPAESYMIKIFDQGKDDIPRIACLPAWNEIDFNNGIKWINNPGIDSSEFSNYRQTLDMYNGLLETSYSWKVNNRKTDINVLSFISRSGDYTAVIKLELTADFSDTVKLSFPLKERESPERMALAKLERINPNPPGNWPAEWYPGFMNITEIDLEKEKDAARIWALSRSDGRGTQVALASEMFYEGNIPGIVINSSETNNPEGRFIEFKFKSEPGRKYTFCKIVSAVSEFDYRGDILKKAISIAQQARKDGFEKLFEEHKEAWAELWETDIIAEGDSLFQKIIRSAVYYLLCSIDEDTEYSLSPMGLASSGYYGHVFWDADTYMFPSLLVMHPDLAESVVMFRYKALEAAKENAVKNNYKGAMYPWESDERGEETTPFFAYQNALKENHIVGDVALAQWQYYLAAGGKRWLHTYGSKVITETAEFWTSRVNYNPELDRYEIGKVVSVSEGLIDISNETYTNVIAKINLELAQKASRILKLEANPRWEEISSKMYIPYNEEEEYHPTYGNLAAGEGATELWSSVVNLLSYPLQMEMSDNAKRNNLMHAVESLRKNGAGANMGSNFLPIIAAELGMDTLFNELIDETLYGYLRPPFYVPAETHLNNSVNFITGSGAFLQQVIFGYTGIRLTDEGFVEKYPPVLPGKIKALTLKNFTINGDEVDVFVSDGKVEIKPAE